MDKTTATLCANLCILSYQNKGEHVTDIFDSEISTIQEFVCENAKGFGIECENTLYICWTGTNDIIDIYDDFQFTTKVPLLLDEKQYGCVHKGFYDYYFSLKNKVNEVIDDFVKSGGSKIVFTGHSLGACITISCLENSLKYPDIDICCITFGSPKIGDKAFVDTFDNVVKHSYRVVDEEDIITNFPIGFGYFHVKNEVTLKGQNPFSWYRFGLNLMRYVWEGRIFAHSLFNYLNKIDGNTI